MKTISLFCACVFLVGIVRGEVSGTNNASADTNLQAHAGQTNAPIRFNRGSELIGIEVWNGQKERLGTIKDLMLNLHQERVVYSVLGTGGFLGLGDKLVAIPPTALEFNEAGKHLILQSDKESLRAAPGFEGNNWPEMADFRWFSDSDRLVAEQEGEDVREAAGAEKSSRSSEAKTNTSQKSALAAPNISRASELIGTTVRSSEREKLGDVKDVALDLRTGKILYVVVAEGGFLGSDQKLFAIPPAAFAASQEPETLVLNVTREEFAKAMPFEADRWPTQPDKTFSTKTEIQEPSGSPRPETDGRTALDQSNSRRDLMITQQLRRAIMRDDTMSVLTRNITIITADGRITVRGTVADQGEVEKIVSFAREIAGNEVTNELTVQDEQESKHETTEPKKQ